MAMTLNHCTMLAATLLLLADWAAPTVSLRASAAGDSAIAQAPDIAFDGRVTDAAEILFPVQEAALSLKLEDLQLRTQHQMVIVTVSSLGGRDIAEFTRDLGNRWGIGREKEDDGVVLLVAPKERQVRIAVGYGLENRLTHEVCSRIIDEIMIPLFQELDYPGAIENGTDAIIDLLSR